MKFHTVMACAAAFGIGAALAGLVHAWTIRSTRFIATSLALLVVGLLFLSYWLTR